MEQRFSLWITAENDGAGGCSIEQHRTLQDAKRAEDNQSEPFGEPTVTEIKLKVEDGKVYYEDYVGQPLGRVWVECTTTNR